MARKRISSVDLNWMIFDRMNEDFPNGVAIAIVPDARLGWRALVGKRSHRSMSPKAVRRFAAIESELQASYGLIAD